MPNQLYPGCTAPVATRYDLTTDDPDFDLTTITAARLKVFFDNGDEAVWSCSMVPIPPDVAIQPGRVRLIRLHDAADIPEGSEGTITVRADVDIPASVSPIRGGPVMIPVTKDGT